MFFTFNQNNSGGRFILDTTVAEYVVIEATNHKQANAIALSIGLYFDGVDDDVDCPCCGDRWFRCGDGSAKMEPTIYDTPVQWVPKCFTKQGEVFCRIFYANGIVEEYLSPGNKEKRKKYAKRGESAIQPIQLTWMIPALPSIENVI